VEKKFYLIFSACVAVLLSFLLCTPTPLGPEAFVALKRFIPYIQAYGECENEVMLIPGGEPVGSSLDYSLALKFYTGRKIWIEGCETASPSIQKKTPEWIILSKENFQRCLSPQDRALYPFQLLMGQQILLSHLFKSPATDPSQPFDLTPLERELKPVIDCKPQSHPRDLYHRY